MFELAAQIFDLQLADAIFLFFLLHLLGESSELFVSFTHLPVHLPLLLLLLGLLLVEHASELLLPLLQLLHLFFSIGLQVDDWCRGRLLLSLSDLFYVLSILVLIRRSSGFLILSGHFISLLLLLKLVDFFLPDAQLVDQYGGLGTRGDTICVRLLPVFLLQVARDLLRMFLLLDRQLLDARLKLLLHLLTLFELVLHVTESLGAAHRVDLLLERKNLPLLLLNLLVDAG